MKYKAFLVEYERGWGSRVEETYEFDTKEERDTFVREYNVKNNPPLPFGQAPDCYWVAQKPNFDS